jgi:hypothetical protein
MALKKISTGAEVEGACALHRVDGWPTVTGAGNIWEIIAIKRPEFKGPCVNPQISEHERPCYDTCEHCTLSDLTPLSRDSLVKAAEGKRFVIIGEEHPREYASRLLKPLMDSGGFRGIFMEAFDMGVYGYVGLLDIIKEGTVYFWNEKKYDRIVHVARLRGLEVHGIDVPLPIGAQRYEMDRVPDVAYAYHMERVASWAQYICEAAAADGRYLILVGDDHLNFSQWSLRHFNLPMRLFELGVRPEEILTISSNRLPDRESRR